MIERRKFVTTGGLVSVAFTGRVAGNLSPAYGGDAAANERTVLGQLGLRSGQVTRMDVKAGTATRNVNSDKHNDWLEVAALTTNEPEQVLALYPADCIPLVLWSEDGDELCLAHIGRAGAQAKLAEKVVEAMKTEPSKLRGWIGPSVRAGSYAFDQKDYDERFDETWKNFTHSKDGKLYVDLTAYVLDDLQKSGVNPQNIAVEPIDTAADKNYFSHYRAKSGQEPEGRNGVFAWLSK